MGVEIDRGGEWVGVGVEMDRGGGVGRGGS